MNPFLKKEWNELEFPENVHLRARNRAWARIRNQFPDQSGFNWRRIILTFASISTVLLVIFFTSRNTEPETGIKIPNTEQIQRAMSHSDSTQEISPLDPVESSESQVTAGKNQIGPTDETKSTEKGLSEEIQQEKIASIPGIETSREGIGLGKALLKDESFSTEEQNPLKIDEEDFEEPTQLVMHFILPETGVRMIWIKDNITSMEED
jgi:hypothetical protein